MNNTSVQPDFNSIEFASNPDKILSPLREQKGLYPYQIPGGPKVFLATRRNDVESVLTNGAVFKVSPALENQGYKDSPFSIAIPAPGHLLATDDEAHKRLREPLESFFTPEVLETYRAYITREAENILTSWKPGEQHDVAPEFSFLIPVKGIAKMLGLAWQKELPEYAIALQLVKEHPEHLPKVTGFHQLLRATIERKKASPKEKNIISVLLKAGLDEDEVLSMSLLIFIAGSGVTSSLISQGIRKILTENNSESFDKEAISKLVNETLFRTSPTNSAFSRYVHEDIVLSGTPLTKGDVVLAMLASANYDLQEGQDPLKNYLSFGKGIHHCIGWYVSKMQAEIALELFYKHFPKAKITNEEWLINMAVRDLMKLEVVLVTK